MIRTSIGVIDFDLIRKIEKLEMSFRLPVTEVDGKSYKKPTAEMLAGLRDMLAIEFRKKVTVFQAWQVWMAAWSLEHRERVRRQSRADVAFWYSVDTDQVSDSQLIGLHANIGRVKAQQTLHQQKYDPTDYQGVYDLVMLAHDDEERALDARTQAQEALINKRARAAK